MANATNVTTKAASTEAKPVAKKTAAERLNAALKGFTPVVPASVSESQKRRDESEVFVQNLFAGVATQLDPSSFEESDEVRESVAKAFSSLKRSQTAFLKAIGATSDNGTSTLPGTVEEAPEVADADAAV